MAEALRGARIARVHTSSMPRARETGEVVAAVLGVGVEVHDGLREVGVESEDAVVARVIAELDDIADQHRGEAVLVVGHQAALGLALARLLPRAYRSAHVEPRLRWSDRARGRRRRLGRPARRARGPAQCTVARHNARLGPPQRTVRPTTTHGSAD